MKDIKEIIQIAISYDCACSFKIKHEGEPTPFGRPFLPSQNYVEISEYGPIRFADIDAIYINPICKKEHGRYARVIIEDKTSSFVKKFIEEHIEYVIIENIIISIQIELVKTL